PHDGPVPDTTGPDDTGPDDTGPDDTGLVTSPPVVMAPRSDGLEVVWSVTEHARGRVELAAVDGRVGGATTIVDCDPYGFVPQGTAVLRVRVDGLGAGSEHPVRTVTAAASDDRRHVSDWKRVRTLDPAAATA